MDNNLLVKCEMVIALLSMFLKEDHSIKYDNDHTLALLFKWKKCLHKSISVDHWLSCTHDDELFQEYTES